MVIVAEQGMSKDKASIENTAWQEMLNHATIKVNTAEKERMCSEAEHGKCAEKFKSAELERVRLEKKLKGAINKSKGYFLMKDQLSRELEDLSKSVQEVESNLHQMKKQYSLALKNLEKISEDIHRERGNIKREDGVGAESSPQVERGCVAMTTEKGTQFSDSDNKNDGDFSQKITGSLESLPQNKTEGTFPSPKKITGKGMHPGSSDTISSLRSNGSGRSSSSLQEVAKNFQKCSLSGNSHSRNSSTGNSLSRNSSTGSSVKRTELLLNVAALQNLKPKNLT